PLLGPHRTPAHAAVRPLPTRRSSDLRRAAGRTAGAAGRAARVVRRAAAARGRSAREHREQQDEEGTHAIDSVRRGGSESGGPSQDRKSTRLNSSHQIISYAVFCLKKK